MSVFKSKFPDVHIPRDKTLPEFIIERLEETAKEDKIALVHGDTETTISYSAMLKSIKKVSSGFIRAGHEPRDVTMFYTPNHVNFALGVYGVLLAGGTVSTCNPLYTAGELAKQLKDTKPKFVVTFTLFVAKVKEALSMVDHTVEKIYVVDKCDETEFTQFTELLADEGDLFKEPKSLDITSNDTAFILFSSGTTGPSKGVMLSHYNIIANQIQTGTNPEIYSFLSDDGNPTMLLFLPMFHAYGLLAILLAGPLLCSSKLVIMQKFDLETFLALSERHKASVLHIVPPIAVALAKHPVVDKFDLSCVGDIYCAAAAMGKDLAEAVMNRLKIKRGLKQGWGMTELSPVGTLSESSGCKYGACGVLIPNTEAKIIDLSDKSKLLGVNERGELCIRGPQVMKGYLNNPEATANTIDAEGWLYTGDIGYFDEEGNLFVVDRLKELIKYKGFQVPPAELEDLLLTNPAIADACVVGLQDEEAGELPRAYVVLKDGHDVSADDVQSFVADKVSTHKKLRGGVVFIKAIPKTASGKMLRRELREQANAKL